jgi:hypothetical protein
MAFVYLVHWNEAEWRDRAAPLAAAGHEVHGHWRQDKAPAWQGFEPQVAVISLERLPAHGREIADWIWSARKRRHVPVVFVGGKPEKVAETRTRFPDAVYCSFDDLVRSIDRVVRSRRSTAPENRVKTAETAKLPSATPLAWKLGIKTGVTFALVDAPDGFLKTLQAPKGATRAKAFTEDSDVGVLFARSSHDLARRLKELRPLVAPKSSLWLAWPKRTSPLAGDLSDEVVRQMGLRAGLVDVKVCAIDDVWSGLKFMIRVKDRTRK